MCCLFVWLALAAVLCAADEPVSGWRGNSTGLWPGSHPPTQWLRIPHGAMEGLRASVDRPPGPGAGDTPRVEKGQVRDWLVIGPFAVDDSIADFDRDVLGGEASIEPSADDKSADHTWQRASAPSSPSTAARSPPA